MTNPARKSGALIALAVGLGLPLVAQADPTQQRRPADRSDPCALSTPHMLDGPAGQRGSSSVHAGPGGVSGVTTLPDGSSVTVSPSAAGSTASSGTRANGNTSASSASTSSAGSSGSGRHSAASSAAAGGDVECVIVHGDGTTERRIVRRAPAHPDRNQDNDRRTP